MWTRLDIIFTLESPLHIGYMPFKGSVISPTRYYIPGKNFWGAVTRQITEHFYKDSPEKDYVKTGKEVKNNFRFSYFYLYDGQTIFIPGYADNEPKYGNISLSEFEHKFIGSRVLTAIDRSKGTAKDESLHETEFIKDKYEDKGIIKKTKILGCIWIKNDTRFFNDGKNKIIINDKGILIDEFNIIEQLTLGGEQNYGFGHVKLESISKNGNIFPIREKSHEGDEILINLEKDQPILLLSHLLYNKDLVFKGDIEPITGRGYYDAERDNFSQSKNYKEKPGNVLGEIRYYFSPGTIIENLDNKEMMVNWNGMLITK
jgi:hypothetical protein